MARQRARYRVVAVAVRAGDLVAGDIVRPVDLAGGDGWRAVEAVVTSRIRGAAADEAVAAWPELAAMWRRLDDSAVLVRLGAMYVGSVIAQNNRRPQLSGARRIADWQVYDRYTLLEMQRLDEMYVQLYEAHLPDEDWVDE